MDDTENDASHQSMQLSDMEEEMLATFAARIAELAHDAVQGKESVHEELAALVDVMPDAARTEVVKRFRAMVQGLRSEAGMGADEMTPEQEAEMRFHQEREESMIAHWLSQKTMKKLREAILNTPGVLGGIVSLGEELKRKGVLMDMSRPNPSQDVGSLPPQQARNAEQFAAQNQDKGQER